MDVERVCCMCGDVGFVDKIFQCIKCHHRFQHSYCSSTYSESSEVTEVCGWCQTDEIQTPKHHGSSKKPTSKLDTAGISNRSANPGNMIKEHEGEENNSEKGILKSPSGNPSPRTRRYKLLKDVMC